MRTDQAFIFNRSAADSSAPFPIHANAGIAPPRFRNHADASLFLECLNSQKAFPQDKWVYPYKMIGDVAKVNPEYENCPIQLYYMMGPTPTLEDVHPVK